VIAARQKIVEGAVGMVEMALKELAQKKVVEFDDERKAPWCRTCWLSSAPRARCTLW